MTSLRTLSCLALLCCAACDDTPADPGGGGGGAPGLAGALVEVRFSSKVGVLLDEVPAAARERAAQALLDAQPAEWEARARRQAEALQYRLTYRNFYYDDRGQLPLPPQAATELQLAATPVRETIDGHDLVTLTYDYVGHLVTPEGSPAEADPALGDVGGVVEEPFTLPVDPDFLLERTGYACMNESDFPPNSVDTVNARLFFDDFCEGGADDGCHVTEPLPTASCAEALTASVGSVAVTVRFERLAFGATLADRWRIGAQSAGGAQLRALQEGVEDHRIVYRYFPPDSCAIAEGCVGGAGWRRLLQFTATVQNLGDADAAIGDVGPDSLPVIHRMVSFSQCHQHMHFNHYGKFTFGDGSLQLGSKRAFCLESTSRYFNNEATPLTHSYGCHFQGVAAGWGDDYIAGLDCQWIDVTTVDTTAGAVSGPLSFEVNPDGFLCEGTPVTDASGAPVYERTTFTNEAGEVEDRLSCEPLPDATADNRVETSVSLPVEGGLVTAPCAAAFVSDKRSCGFERIGDPVACTPGAAITLHCSGADVATPAVVRVCEASQLLGALPCTHREALSTAIQGGAEATLTFPCPAARAAPGESGGLFAAYGTALVGGDALGPVSCSVVP